MTPINRLEGDDLRHVEDHPPPPSRPETLRAVIEELTRIRTSMERAGVYGWPNALTDVIEQLSALAGPQAPSGWQPIETLSEEQAGKTSVLVATPDGVGEAHYLGRDNGWWWINNDPSDHWGKPIYPTHWMPLPASPSASTEQK